MATHSIANTIDALPFAVDVDDKKVKLRIRTDDPEGKFATITMTGVDAKLIGNALVNGANLINPPPARKKRGKKQGVRTEST